MHWQTFQTFLPKISIVSQSKRGYHPYGRPRDSVSIQECRVGTICDGTSSRRVRKISNKASEASLAGGIFLSPGHSRLSPRSCICPSRITQLAEIFYTNVKDVYSRLPLLSFDIEAKFVSKLLSSVFCTGTFLWPGGFICVVLQGWLSAPLFL